MDNIFSQIDKIFEQDEDTAPKWAQKILSEIEELKRLLQAEVKDTPTIQKKQNANDIKSFIRGFRKMLKEDEKFVYQARELSFNYRGLLYDINTHEELSSSEAYYVYGYIFKNNIKIEKIDSYERVVNA